jgi:hypothetical protein
MPSEVSDIKQFIEICRRKDASCTFFPNFTRPRPWNSSVDHPEINR